MVMEYGSKKHCRGVKCQKKYLLREKKREERREYAYRWEEMG